MVDIDHGDANQRDFIPDDHDHGEVDHDVVDRGDVDHDDYDNHRG